MADIIDTSFVEKEFYHEPPKATATPEEWTAWMDGEKKARANAKRAFTKAQDHADTPDQFHDVVMVKQGGVWRQGNIMMGFNGNSDEGTLEGDLGENAKQETHIALVNMEATRNKQGIKSKSRCARNRANKKWRKKEARKNK